MDTRAYPLPEGNVCGYSTHYLEGMLVDTRAYPFHEGMYVGTRAYPFHEGMLVDTLPITWRECLWILGPTHYLEGMLVDTRAYPLPGGNACGY